MNAENPTPRRQPSWHRRLALGLATTTVLAGMGGYYLGGGARPDNPFVSPAFAAPSISSEIQGGNRAMPASFADLVERVEPAVVQIVATQVEKAESNPVPPELRGTPFEEFFRRFGAPQGPSTRRGHSLGSGFIVDPAGYIVTNNHVVGNSDEVKVSLTNGQSYDAKLIGRDDKTDLALLKVEPRGELPYVTFGGDDQIRVGDWVMAVGNPFGLSGTVTVGVLSARGRNIGAGPYDDFLQIDAPINRGNSGGPTFDLQGRVIGVNTAIFSPSGGNVGIGFAVPASLAKPVIEQLKTKGVVERGWLGVRMQPLTDELAKAMKLSQAEGALIAGVDPDSPAAKGNLRQGDVIVEFAGHKIGEPRDLARAVAEAPIGKPAKVVVQREGERTTLEVRPGQASRQQQASAGGESGAEQSGATLGLALAPLDSSARARFGLQDDVKGAVITGIKDDSPAAEAGLRPGDVITKVGSTAVASPSDVADAVQQHKKSDNKAIALLVLRRGVSQYVALPLDDA
ncbi:DegQ family serine endoprotease [Desertibaculum subflavum]|uniref:DegQ family serine endoprotease n=1 Tax=Desertibaculum subflavum TaxID=2268458 RepID=UPI000E66538C